MYQTLALWTLVSTAADVGQQAEVALVLGLTLPRLGSAALHGAGERSQRMKESLIIVYILFNYA